MSAAGGGTGGVDRFVVILGHIAEHNQSGMMFSFYVTEEAGR